MAWAQEGGTRDNGNPVGAAFLRVAASPPLERFVQNVLTHCTVISTDTCLSPRETTVRAARRAPCFPRVCRPPSASRLRAAPMPHHVGLSGRLGPGIRPAGHDCLATPSRREPRGGLGGRRLPGPPRPWASQYGPHRPTREEHGRTPPSHPAGRTACGPRRACVRPGGVRIDRARVPRHLVSALSCNGSGRRAHAAAVPRSSRLRRGSRAGSGEMRSSTGGSVG